MIQVSEDLIKKCRQNDRRAHNELYKTLFSFLMNIAFRYKNNRDDAGAAVNGIFMKVILNMPDFENYKSFVPWVKKVAIRFLIDEYRKGKRMRTDFVESYDGYDTNEASSPSALDRLKADDLLKLISELPEETGKVFNLFAIDGFKHEEIGEMLDITESSSKWHVFKARKELKQKISRLEELEIKNVSNG
jgi:RNA polymerase sigma-70 factor (ECF subfamily)